MTQPGVRISLAMSWKLSVSSYGSFSTLKQPSCPAKCFSTTSRCSASQLIWTPPRVCWSELTTPTGGGGPLDAPAGSSCGNVVFKTPPCVRSKRPRVYRHHVHMLKHKSARCRYTLGRFERTHGGVLDEHTEGLSACLTTPHTHHDHDDNHSHSDSHNDTTDHTKDTTTTATTTTTTRHTPQTTPQTSHALPHTTSKGERQRREDEKEERR